MKRIFLVDGIEFTCRIEFNARTKQGILQHRITLSCFEDGLKKGPFQKVAYASSEHVLTALKEVEDEAFQWVREGVAPAELLEELIGLGFN